MNKREFAEKVAQNTGIGFETSLRVLNKLEEFNIFSKNEKENIRAAIAETADCDNGKAEEIRSEIMNTVSGEAKSIIPKAAVSAAIIAAAAFTVVKLLKNKEK